MNITHPFKPIYNKYSKVLILGSFPSVKSREHEFYYAHPQNRFWKVIANICNMKIPTTIKEKEEMLIKNNIAIWDVIESCDIEASADSSIKNVVVNDISKIIAESNIKKVLFNGNVAYDYFMKYYNRKENNLNLKILNGLEYIKLPSTSPANAKYSLEKLIEIWGKYIKL